MSTLRRVLALLASLIALSAVAPARAQTTTGASTATVVTAGITHTIARDGYRLNTLLNYADCVNDDAIKFPITLTNPSVYTLQAWVGLTDCTASTARSGSIAQCWLVDSVVPNSTSISTIMQIPVRSIVSGYTLGLGVNTTTTTTDTGTAGTSGTGGSGGTGGSTSSGGATTTTTTTITGDAVNVGPEACVQPNPTTVISATNFSVQFMLIDPSTNAVVGTPSSWAGSFKLVGPQPPDNLSAGIGGNLLVVSFSYNNPGADQTINGYNFYCDPPPGGANAIDAGLLEPDASAGTALACGVPTSTVLMPGGAVPSSAYQCGTAQKTSGGGNATGLVDGVPYNIAIAAVDTYENTGTLSILGCGVPQPITGFFQAYRNAGGQAGGGYCSFSMKKEPMPLLALLGLASCLALRRRRVA